ncbi:MULTISPECIES: PRC-barrel domain-containing protein [unclassified Azospirillum]|uniref:PRC-barrel domain-containing protein n=1 Tax=unclassified Azospirillum TaxID=2630922 RepID=UPI000B6A6F7E|nr:MULTISPECIES: PRC-barrel domain-containing protein [unclassified Azospirillum]SNS76022.1 PRC-barrel domain-containing protein [Azospirillum sp. RU38E]SNS93180.1 PRC-barrel domain-containing protein [Azospirillum sp. RU37A]
MTRFNIIMAGLAVATLSAVSLAFAQGAPQTIALTQVDPTTLATGYRTSKVVGSTVYNAAGETVGTIDDLIVTPNDKVPFAVLSVGGFLGMGSKYVVVSYAALNVTDKKFVLNDATKETLKGLPEYKYTR